MLPPSDDNEPFRKRLNTWIQTIGIVVAGIWACYAFVYKEIRAPKLAPINVTVDLRLAPSQGRILYAENVALIPIELTISARNPSPRTVALLSSVFIVHGFNYSSGEPTFDDELNRDPIHRDGTFDQRHAHVVRCTTIATGSAVLDDSLRPGEVLVRNLVIYVPDKGYDVLEASVAFPTTVLGSKIQARWTFDAAANALNPTYYVTKGKGEKPVSPSEPLALANDLQVASTHMQLAVPGSPATLTPARQ